jgi:hypothetical protein
MPTYDYRIAVLPARSQPASLKILRILGRRHYQPEACRLYGFVYCRTVILPARIQPASLLVLCIV